MPNFRPFYGALEFPRSLERWIFAFHDASPNLLANPPNARERIPASRAYRQVSGSAPTRKLAATPTLNHKFVYPNAPLPIIPGTSWERWEFAPVGWLVSQAIAGDAIHLPFNATSSDFTFLASAIQMAWFSEIGGRLKGDYWNSIGLVYNTLAMPAKTRSSGDQTSPPKRSSMRVRSFHAQLLMDSLTQTYYRRICAAHIKPSAVLSTASIAEVRLKADGSASNTC